MERKDFIKKFAVGGSILLAVPVLFNSCSEEELPDGDDGDPGGNPNAIEINLNDAAFSALATVGGFAYKGDIIVIRTSDTNYLALSKICTHSGCTITYNHSSSELPCPCHGSKFSTSGTVVNGPAESNLKTYAVVKENNVLKIT